MTTRVERMQADPSMEDLHRADPADATAPLHAHPHPTCRKEGCGVWASCNLPRCPGMA
jgi:hypothetical protein